jgi:hypothetical protein
LEQSWNTRQATIEDYLEGEKLMGELGCTRYFLGWNRQGRTFQVRRYNAAAFGGGN